MLKFRNLFVILITFLPLVSNAQGTSLQNLIINLGWFFEDYVIPFLLGIAFLIFVINAIRYFVAGGGDEEAQKKAKSLALYGISAFVLLIIFFGVVNLLSNSIGLQGQDIPVPDYIRLRQ